jgi:hypothetical protein
MFLELNLMAVYLPICISNILPSKYSSVSGDTEQDRNLGSDALASHIGEVKTSLPKFRPSRATGCALQLGFNSF